MKQTWNLLIFSFIQTKFLGTARNNLDLVTKETHEESRKNKKHHHQK